MGKKIGKYDVVPTYPGSRSKFEGEKAPREKIIRFELYGLYTYIWSIF